MEKLANLLINHIKKIVSLRFQQGQEVQEEDIVELASALLFEWRGDFGHSEEEIKLNQQAMLDFLNSVTLHNDYTIVRLLKAALRQKLGIKF